IEIGLEGTIAPAIGFELNVGGFLTLPSNFQELTELSCFNLGAFKTSGTAYGGDISGGPFIGFFGGGQKAISGGFKNFNGGGGVYGGSLQFDNDGDFRGFTYDPSLGGGASFSSTTTTSASIQDAIEGLTNSSSKRCRCE
ncbi:MAG: hypothetical protein ABEH43_10080, partial [Flavobacteriales bacterium]